MFLNPSTTRTDGGWMYFKINHDNYIQLPGSDNKVNIYKDTSISGNLGVGKVLNLQRHPTESDTIPLVITNTSSSGSGFIRKSVSTVKGCLFEYLTSASSTSWWQGVLSGSNEFVTKTGSNGLTIKSNSSAVLSGSLPNSDASLKGNVEEVDLTDCTDMLENIDVKTYTRNDMEEGNKRLGFIAQVVKAYLPDKFDNIIGSNIITDEQGENSKEIMTMGYARMVCVL